MAHNELKPNYSSSEDEEEEEASGSEDEQSSGSDSEEVSDSPSEDKQTLIPPPKSAVKPQAPDNSSEPEESGSDTDSDPDSVSPAKKPAVADPTIQPIRSIPMEREDLNPGSELAKKSGSTPPPARSKRPAAAVLPASEKDAKKQKTNSTEDDSKKQLFQRLWSEDDEIVILKGMADYKAETGESSIADMGVFHEFIKKSLHVDVSKAQLADKIRRLKKKYVNNVSKEKDGKDRSFSKSHEQKGYELSKLVWGGNNSGGNNSRIESKKSSKSQKNGSFASTSTVSGVTLVKCNGLEDKEVEKNMDVSRFVRYGGNDGPISVEEIVKAGMELAEGSKKMELEEKWRRLKKEELELYLKKMDLVKEQALIVLDAVNSSGN